MFTRKIVSHSILLALFGMLSGCSGLGGKDKFSCPGMPDGITCADPITIYDHSDDINDLNKLRSANQQDKDEAESSSTYYDPLNDEDDYRAMASSRPSEARGNNGTEVPRNAGKFTEDEGQPGTLVKVTSVRRGKKSSAVYQSYINQKQLIVSPSSPMPVLQPAEVARIWVAPWTDQNQDLHWAGYVFTEITPRRWSFGESAVGAIQPTLPVLIDNGHHKRFNRRARAGRRYQPGHMRQANSATHTYPTTKNNYQGREAFLPASKRTNMTQPLPAMESEAKAGRYQ